MKKLIPTLVLLIMLSACTGNFNSKTPTVIAPTITEFIASSESIIAGEEDVTFNWTIEGTDPINVVITSLGNPSGTIETFTPEDNTVTFAPIESTTYTITAENSAATVTKDLAITVWHRCGFLLLSVPCFPL